MQLLEDSDTQIKDIDINNKMSVDAIEISIEKAKILISKEVDNSKDVANDSITNSENNESSVNDNDLTNIHDIVTQKLNNTDIDPSNVDNCCSNFNSESKVLNGETITYIHKIEVQEKCLDVNNIEDIHNNVENKQDNLDDEQDNLEENPNNVITIQDNIDKVRDNIEEKQDNNEEKQDNNIKEIHDIIEGKPDNSLDKEDNIEEKNNDTKINITKKKEQSHNGIIVNDIHEDESCNILEKNISDTISLDSPLASSDKEIQIQSHIDAISELSNTTEDNHQLTVTSEVDNRENNIHIEKLGNSLIENESLESKKQEAKHEKSITTVDEMEVEEIVEETISTENSNAIEGSINAKELNSDMDIMKKMDDVKEMDVEEIIENKSISNNDTFENTIVTSNNTLETKTNDDTVNSEKILEKKIHSGLSNTLDIISDDDEEVTSKTSKCINVEDDDDIMLIEDECSKDTVILDFDNRSETSVVKSSENEQLDELKDTNLTDEGKDVENENNDNGIIRVGETNNDSDENTIKDVEDTLIEVAKMVEQNNDQLRKEDNDKVNNKIDSISSNKEGVADTTEITSDLKNREGIFPLLLLLNSL